MTEQIQSETPATPVVEVVVKRKIAWKRVAITTVSTVAVLGACVAAGAMLANRNNDDDDAGSESSDSNLIKMDSSV